MNESNASRARARDHRVLWLSIATVFPVAIALALAAVDVWQLSGQPRIPCPLYPNAVVAFAAELHEDCPLEPGDSILGMQVHGRTEAIDTNEDLEGRLREGIAARLVIRRAGESTDRQISVLPMQMPLANASIQLVASMMVAGLLLAVALLTAVRSGVAAATPFAWIHASLGVVIVAAAAGWMSARSYPITAAARAVLPAALAHLAFVFPRTREIAIRVPGIHRFGYGIAFGLLLLELNSTYRGSFSTMLLIQRIEMAAAVIALSLICFSSWLSIWESPSRLERGQAKVFLSGLAMLLAAVLVAGSIDVLGPLTAVTLGAALSPLPLGYAIARYHLFDFGTTLRRTVAHVLYLSIWSGLFFLGVVLLRDELPIPEWLRNPVVMFAGVYAVLAPIDGLRHLLKRFIEHAFQPGARTWANLSEGRASQLAHLRDSDAIARAAVSLAAASAPNAGVSLFLREGSTLRLAHASGEGACEQPSMASIALRLVGAGVADLNRVDTVEPEAAMVYEAGVELVSVIATGDKVHGVLLLCPSRRGVPHPVARIAWLRMVSLHGAAALENVRLAEQLRVSEEFATRGRMHAELAHEIGKPLGALEVMAQRLAVEADASPPVRERAMSIARISGQLRDIVRGVLEAGRSRDRIEVADLVERARLEIASVHGRNAVCVLPMGPLPALERSADRAVRALTNLIDNAIHASATGEAVEVGARAVEGGVEIEVVDRGCGIARADLERVFDAFVSFRPDGNGLGLTISRQIVEQLGGTLVLESAPGRGTRARMRLPAARGS